MTEKDIEKEALTTAEYLNFECSSDEDIRPTVAKAFKMAIEWYMTELWHSFREEPEMDEQVLCIDTENETKLLWQDGDWKEKVGIYEVVKWCYITDL